MTDRFVFGGKLRHQRERRGTTLASIAEQTKISSSLLSSLEDGTCARWPGGVYSRAYVRSYADAIGADRDEICAEFCECFPELAWPERAGAALQPPVPESPAARTQLRLTLEVAPEERWRETARRSLIGLCDAVVMLALAAAGRFLAGLDFWATLAVVGLIVQVAAATSGRAALLGGFRRKPASRVPRPTAAAAASDDFAEAVSAPEQSATAA